MSALDIELPILSLDATALTAGSASEVDPGSREGNAPKKRI
ncbi:hypothetical protein [Bradyrhizobium sp. Gha]|nr:hypothetical protein [Bradyrhizobium sp. Gha]